LRWQKVENIPQLYESRQITFVAKRMECFQLVGAVLRANWTHSLQPVGRHIASRHLPSTNLKQIGCAPVLIDVAMIAAD